jgi:hypothetical protein
LVTNKVNKTSPFRILIKFYEPRNTFALHGKLLALGALNKQNTRIEENAYFLTIYVFKLHKMGTRQGLDEKETIKVLKIDNRYPKSYCKLYAVVILILQVAVTLDARSSNQTRFEGEPEGSQCLPEELR